ACLYCFMLLFLNVTTDTDTYTLSLHDALPISDQDVTSPRGNADAWMVKFDGNGTKIWQKSFGGSQFDTAHSIVQRSNGDYILSGHSRSNDGDLLKNNGSNDVWIFGVDNSGNLKYQKSIGGSELDFASDAIETSDNKIVAVGNSESNDLDIPLNQGSKDFLLIKLK